MNRMRTARWIPRLVSAAVLIAAWELLAWWINGLLFPSFTQTVTAAVQVVPSPQFWRAVWVSHEALLIGFAIAAVIGIAAGLVMGRWPAADAFVDPYLAHPARDADVGLIPIVIPALGLKPPARGGRGPLRRGGRRAQHPNRKHARRNRVGWKWRAGRERAPAVVDDRCCRRRLWPSVTGLRLGLGRAFTGMIAVELLLVAVGIGRLILEFQGLFESGAVYAVILFLVVEAVLLLRLLRYAERRLAPWAGLVATE
jgi:NitT/TauT family transport system permease protein